MKKLIVYVLIAGCSLLGFGQEVLVIPYDANSLTDEQRNSNPDYLIYPASLKDSVSSIMMVCEENEFAFSVSATDKVMFSPGNLQYHPANDEWRFAPNQWDYIGVANSNCSSIYNGWLDLFGWGTGDAPTKSSTSYSDYSTFVDWGTNKIGNDAPNTWRTLTYNEWNYMVFDRPNASSLRGAAQVNGVNGLILLPDNWTCPAGVTFKSGFHSESSVEAYGQYQTSSADQWSKLESAGAVFLPASGNRYGSNVVLVQNKGYYWSVTEDNSDFAYFLYFDSDEAYMSSNHRSCGQSVRLVKDL